MADRVDSSSLDVNAEGKPELAVSPMDLQWLGTILWDGPPPSRDHFKESSANREPTSASTAKQQDSDLGIDDGNDPRQIDASTTLLPAQGMKKRNSVSLVLKPSQKEAKNATTNDRDSESVQIDRQPLRSAQQQEKPNSVPERKARQNVEAFYGTVLKRALDQLQDSISQGRHSQSLLLSKSSNAQASTHKSAQMARAKGDRLKTQFFQNLLSKAKSRTTIEPSTARP